MRAPDIVRVAAERYNKLSGAEKQKYVDQFEVEKRVFDEQQGRGWVEGAKRGRGRHPNDYSLN